MVVMLFVHATAHAQPARCVRVTIRLEQEAVISRSAFRASLTLKNESAGPVTSIFAAPDIRNPQGEASNAKFGIAAPDVTGMTSVNGTGTLAPGAEGTATWLIVPRDEAAPTEPLIYGFGGTLQYVANGSTLTIPMEQVQLTVVPNPRLQPKYFWEKYVYSDDPFTSTVEPSRPFTVALMMSNVGAGTARNMRITTAQPRIVRNDDELVIAFQLIDSQVDNQPQTPSLNLTLGDIAPGQSRIARYRMTSTLQGKFISYTASYQHLSDLGGVVSSLIDEGYPKVFELIHPVQSQEQGADALPDFLTDEKSGLEDPNESDTIPEFFDLPDTLHLSDNTIAPVQNIIDATVNTTGAASASLAATASTDGGWRYIVVDDPFGGVRPIQQIVRSDGRILHVENTWQTDRIFQPAGNNVVYRARLHLFDKGGSGQYTITFGEPTVLPALPVITTSPIAQTVCNGQPATLSVAATSTAPLSYQWRRDGLPITGQISPSIEILAASLADTGSYDCVVSNARGGVASSSAQLTVTDSALITVQPFNRVVCTGGATTFSVTAIAPGTINYEWRRDGFPVANGNGPTLIISNASAANIGTYDCVLTSSCGSTTTSAATLQVVTPPSITQQPAPAIACSGSSASFTVAATGAAPFTYRWRKDGVNVPGGTEQTLVVSGISAANAGVYDCIVSNACGSVTSSGASLRIPGSVTQQPESLATCSGGSFSLTIAAAEATGYQWFKDGQPLVNGPRPSGALVSGATSPTLNLSGVALAESGEYRCEVTSSCTPVFSATAQVTISDPTIRAHFSGPIASATGDSPQGVVGSSLVFDSLRGFALLFGGRRGSTPSDQTWVWNNSEWARAFPADHPPARSDAAVAFSAASGVTLLMGGQGSTDLLADAWLWDGSSWQQIAVPGGLSKRRGSALAFDEIRGVFVLFGGFGKRADLSTGPLNDTWEFDGSDWTLVSTPLAPPAREQAGLSFMLGQDVCILHGGSASAGVLGDTWAWNGSTWTPISGERPVARATHAQVFDSRRGVVRIFGGRSAAATALSDVWEFDGSTWSQVPTGSSGGMGGRVQMAAAYDTVRGKQILWGGSNGAGQQVEELWSMSLGVFGLSEQPVAAASCQGAGLILRVTPAVPGVYTYQWLRSGQPIADSEFVTGTTSPVLDVSYIPSAVVGSYGCVVRDSCGEVRSELAAVESVGSDLMSNGSFESGTTAWVFVQGLEPLCEPGAARTGQCHVAFAGEFAAGAATQLLQRPVERFEIAQLSFWARRHTPGESAYASLETSNTQTGAGDLTLVELTDEWQLFGVDVNAAAVLDAIDRIVVRAAIGPGGEVSAADIDDVVLRVRCAADFNCDGGVDGSDIEPFYLAWSDGDLSADANQDGGVDGSDVDAFMTAWSEGGC
jgi:hypothetical protein